MDKTKATYGAITHFLVVQLLNSVSEDSQDNEYTWNIDDLLRFLGKDVEFPEKTISGLSYLSEFDFPMLGNSCDLLNWTVVALIDRNLNLSLRQVQKKGSQKPKSIFDVPYLSCFLATEDSMAWEDYFWKSSILLEEFYFDFSETPTQERDFRISDTEKWFPEDSECTIGTLFRSMERSFLEFSDPPFTWEVVLDEYVGTTAISRKAYIQSAIVDVEGVLASSTNLSESTKEAYLSATRRLCNYCFDQKFLELQSQRFRFSFEPELDGGFEGPEIRYFAPFVSDYLKDRKSQGVSPSTIHLEQAAFCKFFEERQVHIPNSERRFFAGDKIAQYQPKNETEEDILHFARSTGLNRSEMVKLKKKDVFEENGECFVRIRSSKHPDTIDRVSPCLDFFPLEYKRHISGHPESLLFFVFDRTIPVFLWRRLYLRDLYLKHARTEIPKESQYVCRGDRKGLVFDNDALEIVRVASGLGRTSHVLDLIFTTGFFS